MMTWAIWTQWKWNPFASGKCNLKVSTFLAIFDILFRIWLVLIWFGIFCISEKYEYVGRLLRPGEEPNSYSDEEDESSESAKASKSEDITNITDATTATPQAPTPASTKKDEWLVRSRAITQHNSPIQATKLLASEKERSNCSSNQINNREKVGTNGTNDLRQNQ